jgi:3-oxoacyl-[acyl-carrier protein] reductase
VAIDQLPARQLDAALDVDLKMAFWLAANAPKHLQASTRHPGFLVVSSITGNRQCQPGYAAYGASQAALNSFVRMAAVEWAPCGIRVNGVEPGLTLTENLEVEFPAGQVRKIERLTPLGTTAEPVDLANALLFFASAEAKLVAGQFLVVDGGQSLAS